MMTAALIILAIQTVLGALDNILHHELTERLPSRPSARRELALHSAREAIYAVLFLIFAWLEPAGLFAAIVLALLLVEVAITVADFIEEDRTRRLPPFERVLHTLLAVLYGAFLAIAVPWLAIQTGEPSTIALVSHGLLSWFFTVAALGVSAFALRNALAVRNLSHMRPPPRAVVEPSGRTILITGATGFIGSALIERLAARGDRIIAVVRDRRQAAALLGDHIHIVESLDAIAPETQIGAVVNLAGAPILGLPWIGARRREIWRSRVQSTDTLVRHIAMLHRKPKVLVSGSAIGFYGDRGDDALDETKAKGEGFAADLCAAWESSAMRAKEWGIRTVCLRMGLVLDRSGGALPMMALPMRLGFGAILGSGRQWMSWIARDDLLRMIISAIDDERWDGSVNAVAPEPLRHADFQKALARSFRKPLFLAAPAWLLRTMLGEMSSILLDSQRVVPARARALGFAFDVCWASDALHLQFGPPPAPLPSLKPPPQALALTKLPAHAGQNPIRPPRAKTAHSVSGARDHEDLALPPGRKVG